MGCACWAIGSGLIHNYFYRGYGLAIRWILIVERA